MDLERRNVGINHVLFIPHNSNIPKSTFFVESFIANCRAASKPIPALAPVTRIVEGTMKVMLVYRLMV